MAAPLPPVCLPDEAFATGHHRRLPLRVGLERPMRSARDYAIETAQYLLRQDLVTRTEAIALQPYLLAQFSRAIQEARETPVVVEAIK